MLTREGFVAADMSGPHNLQRSSWKAEAIRRGDLKISGPIPITEDMPLNEEEEKEFAETGALSPVQAQDEHELEDEEKVQRPQTPPQHEQTPPVVLEEPEEQVSRQLERQSLHPEMIHKRQTSRSPLRMHQVADMPRESIVPTNSQIPSTPLRSTPESSTKVAQKKKRKSGLRNVFRKMFGRKSKDEPEMEEAARRGHSYHHSDPGMLRQSPPRAVKTANGPRISDPPVEDLQPMHPLGQHLPFPMNVNAPQASPPKEYLNFDMQRRDIGRRRATLPSIPSADVQRHSLTEARGRLSTWDERLEDDGLVSPGIGIALSSPTQATTPTIKRRSRSADALRELVKDGAPLERRRSAEIRHWRQSYTSGSINSRPQTAKTIETIRSVQMQEPAIIEPDEEVREMSATLAHVDESSPLPTPFEPTVIERELTEPPNSAFNFGLKSNISSPGSAPLEPLVPASPPLPERSTQRLSMEDRVANLEGTFQSLELSFRRLSTRNNRQTIILSDAPRTLRSRTRDRDSSSQSASTSTSSHVPAQYPSNDTLKSSPESPVLLRPGTGERGGEEVVIEKLYEALKYERSARKALEQQFRNLQHDVADLHALINKLIASATATSPSYPTPSPDTLVTSTEERLLTPRAKEFGGGKHDGRENLIGRFNREGSSERGEDGEWRSEDVNLASPHDVWATPKEEGFSGSGFFHEREGEGRMWG